MPDLFSLSTLVLRCCFSCWRPPQHVSRSQPLSLLHVMAQSEVSLYWKYRALGKLDISAGQLAREPSYDTSSYCLWGNNHKFVNSCLHHSQAKFVSDTLELAAGALVLAAGATMGNILRATSQCAACIGITLEKTTNLTQSYGFTP